MLDASVIVNYPGGTDPLWSLVTGFGGALVGGGAAFLGVWYTQRRSDQRAAEEADERRREARDRRNEERMTRLRSLYAPFVNFSDVINLVRSEKAFLYKDEDMDQRDKRHDGLIRQAGKAVAEVQGAVVLELDADPVVTAANEAWRALYAYLGTVRNDYQLQAGPTYANQLKSDAEALETASEKLRHATREHIKQLEASLGT
ncbi:hypothetical protein AB6813_11775 [bacterium RCC_150]